MASRAQSVVLALACAGCGLDVVGSGAPGASDASTNGATADAGIGAIPITGDGRDGGLLGPLCDPSRTSLLVCFRFEGAVIDESGKGLASVQATNLGFVPGREGSGARFTVTPKSELRLPFDTLNTPRVTIEMWLKPDALPSGEQARAMLMDQNGRFGIALAPDGTLRCRSVVGKTKAAVGVWTHLACVHDGVTLTTYVNGVAEGSAANSLSDTEDPVFVGSDSPGGGDPFEGTIDNLRIWSEPLSAAEVAAAAAR